MDSPPRTPSHAILAPNGSSSKNSSTDHNSGEFRPEADLDLVAPIPFNLLRMMASAQAEFYLFKYLPTDLRWRIWDYNLPGPRFVPVAPFITENPFDPDEEEDTGELQGGELWQYVSDRVELPVSAQVNQDSRAHFRKSYKLMFKNTLLRRPVYFHPNIDTLLLIRTPKDTFKDLETDKVVETHDDDITDEEADEKIEKEWSLIQENVKSIAFEDLSFPGMVTDVTTYFPNLQEVALIDFSKYTAPKKVKEGPGAWKLTYDGAKVYEAAWKECDRKRRSVPVPKIKSINFEKGGVVILDPSNGVKKPTFHKDIGQWLGMGEAKEFDHRKCVLIDNERVDKNFLLGPGGEPCGCGNHENAKKCRSESRYGGAESHAYEEWLEDHDPDVDDFDFVWNKETEEEYCPGDISYAEYWSNYD